MKKFQVLILALFMVGNIYGQKNTKYYKFQTEIKETVRVQIFKALDSLLVQLTTDKFNDTYLAPDLKGLTTDILSNIKRYESEKDSIQKKQIDKQLLRGYPIDDNEYFLTLAFIKKNSKSTPILYYIINLIAKQTSEKILFSIPLHYYTKDWKQTQIGAVTYHHKNNIEIKRAKIFDLKNTTIANKLETDKENFDFYMCENYQEVQRLLGIGFSIYENSKYRTGYGVSANTIFSIMNNEDFSHDVFHHYSSKVNKRENRNWITEEGIAYLWGNAYYTDPDGEMITHQKLVNELKKYLSENPDVELLNLFENDVKIFNHIAPEISVRSTISGVIANQVEKLKGADGISKLINAGSENQLDSFLKTTNLLLRINKENFNLKVKELLNNNH